MEMTHFEAVIKLFASLDDPRQAGKVQYPLPEILLLVLCAAICSADSIVEIVEFGELKLDFLRTLLPYKNGIPSHDTIGKLLASIDYRQFSEAFIKWTNEILQSIPELVAIDGKTQRRTMNGDIPPAHIISAWATKQNMVLGQLKTEAKSNEITAIPQLLDMLVLTGATITIDAIGCQTKIAEKIIDKKADYVLAVKGNQKKLHQEIKKAFAIADDENSPYCVESLGTIEKGHGRIEVRKYDVCYEIGLLEDRYNWPKLEAFCRVVSTREMINGATTTSTRFFISSRALTPELFISAVRGHWSIENKLHWVLDMVFREDESRARIKNLAANLATLKHISFNILKKLNIKPSVRVRRKLAGWDNSFMFNVLRTQATTVI